MAQICSFCQTSNRDAAKYCRGCAVKFSSADEGGAPLRAQQPAFVAVAHPRSEIDSAQRRVAGIPVPPGLDVSVVWVAALMVLSCTAFALWYANRSSMTGALPSRAQAAASVVQLAPVAPAAQIPLAVPTRDIPIESVAGGPADAVEQFYRALSLGDGEAAAELVTPAKRGVGPFKASNISAFYRSFNEPLAVRSVRQIDANLVEAKYSYRVSKTQCNGTALVNTERVSDRMLIRSIRANC